jgi:anthranilate phosphoribosyltransferase
VHAAESGSLHEQLAAGIARAEQAVDSGGAAQVLERWVAASR